MPQYTCAPCPPRTGATDPGPCPPLLGLLSSPPGPLHTAGIARGAVHPPRPVAGLELPPASDRQQLTFPEEPAITGSPGEETWEHELLTCPTREAPSTPDVAPTWPAWPFPEPEPG